MRNTHFKFKGLHPLEFFFAGPGAWTVVSDFENSRETVGSGEKKRSVECCYDLWVPEKKQEDGWKIKERIS